MKQYKLIIKNNTIFIDSSIIEHYVQNMNKKINDDEFNILRKIHLSPYAAQRELAKNLGISLGKINYCLKQLQLKGLVKLNNFRNNKNKVRYLYILTPRGISAKTKLTINFMKKKMKEYDQLKLELEKKN